jgi:hypothetical protein
VRGPSPRVVVRSVHCLVLLQLHPSVLGQIVVNLLEQGLPVLNRSAHGPTVDEIEFLVVRPRGLDVIDKEAAVGRVGAGLDGRQVDPDHLTIGMLVGKVDRPRSGSRPKIEYMAWLGRQRGAAQTIAKDHAEDMMRQVEPFLLLLVVG